MMLKRAVGVSLLGVCAALLVGGSVDAQAADPSSPTTTSAPGTPLISLSLGSVSLGLTTPVIGVSLPTASEPDAPLVSVSTPGVSVSVAGVSVSVPSVGVSVPSAPTGSAPSEAPTGAAPAPPPTSGGAPTAPTSPGGSSSAPVEMSGGSNAASAPASAAATTARSAAPSPGAAAADRTAGAGGHRPSLGGVGESRSIRAGRGRRRAVAHASAGSAVNGGAPPAALRSRSRGVVRGSSSLPRAAAHTSSNPLDTVGEVVPLPVPVPDWSKPIILALLLLAIWFGVRARLAARRARRLEGEHVTLLRALGVMQSALVPEVPARLGGLAVSVAYRPAEGPAAGGDFYDVFVPAQGKVAIILGDVAGHGHRALSRAALTRYTLRAYLQAGLEPRAALALAGRVLVDPTGEHFATVAVGVYEARAGRLTYASAGHPPPILGGFQADEPVTVCSSPPLGWDIPTGRRQTTVSLPAGAQVCFFSDGLIEARAEEGLLGRERLTEILAALGSRPKAAKLLERVRAAAVATPDDMAACILTAEAAAAAAPIHVEELEADSQALSAVRVRRFLEACRVPAAQSARVIARASEIAATCDTALLRVELGPTGATATATAPGERPSQAASEEGPRAAGEPLARAQPTGSLA